MPPFINTDIIDGNVVAEEVFEESSSEEDDEIEEALPEPVTNTHHFDFRRVQNTFACSSEIDPKEMLARLRFGRRTEECWNFKYDIAVIGGAVRKLVRSSGDIWYVYGRQGSCGYTQNPWIGTEVGCAQTARTVTRCISIFFTKSIRTYPDVRRFQRAYSIIAPAAIFCAVEKCHSLCVHVQHGSKLGNMPSATQRNSIMVQLHNQMRPPHRRAFCRFSGRSLQPHTNSWWISKIQSCRSFIPSVCAGAEVKERECGPSMAKVVQITSEDVTEM